MNLDFMRLLAQRLERVPWIDVRSSGCTFPAVFEGVNGFFMTTDLMAAPDRHDVMSYGDRRVGSIAAWAAQLIQEQGGYHDEARAWIEALAQLEAHEVNELSWRGLGLGKEELTEEEPAEFVLDGHIVDALLSPPFLHGCMRGIGPAAAVLRRRAVVAPV